MDQGKSTSDKTPIETAKPENQGLNTPLTSPCKQDPINELRVFNSGFQNFFSSHIHLYGTKIFNKGYAIMMLASLQLRRHHKGHFRKGYAIMMLASLQLRRHRKDHFRMIVTVSLIGVAVTCD